MKKILFAALFLVVLAVAVVWKPEKLKQTAEGDKPVVKIGFSLPLTGGLANVGKSFNNTVLLARDDLAKKNLKNKYEFVIEDDGFEAKKVASNFHKFQSIDKVDAVVSFASMTGNVIAPLAERNQIIYVNFGASDKNIVKGKYSFIHWNLPQKIAEGMLDLYAKKGFKKVAFIAENDAGVVSIEKAFADEAKERGIENKAFFVLPKEKDYRLLLSKIEGEYNPDVYLVMIWTDSIVPFVKQFKEAGIDKPITNLETFAILEHMDVAEGAYFVDSSQSTKSLTDRLKKAYPDTSSEFGTGNAYDVVMLIVEAFENADSKDKAVDVLANIKEYDGVARHITQDENGIFQSDAIVKKIVNGVPVMVEE